MSRSRLSFPGPLQVRANRGTPGVDDVSIDDVAAAGVESLLDELAEPLRTCAYRPLPLRRGLPPPYIVGVLFGVVVAVAALRVADRRVVALLVAMPGARALAKAAGTVQRLGELTAPGAEFAPTPLLAVRVLAAIALDCGRPSGRSETHRWRRAGPQAHPPS